MIACSELPGSVMVDSRPCTSVLPPVIVPPAPSLPAETTATTPVPTSWSSSRHSGLCPAANSSGYHSQPMDRFTPWMSSWRPSELNVRTWASAAITTLLAVMPLASSTLRLTR